MACRWTYAEIPGADHFLIIRHDAPRRGGADHDLDPAVEDRATAGLIVCRDEVMTHVIREMRSIETGMRGPEFDFVRPGRRRRNYKPPCPATGCAPSANVLEFPLSQPQQLIDARKAARGLVPSAKNFSSISAAVSWVLEMPRYIRPRRGLARAIIQQRRPSRTDLKTRFSCGSASFRTHDGPRSRRSSRRTSCKIGVFVIFRRACRTSARGPPPYADTVAAVHASAASIFSGLSAMSLIADAGRGC